MGVGRERDATRVKIESAEHLATGGRVRESAQINSIKPADLNAVNVSLREKFQRVQSAVEAVQKVPRETPAFHSAI
jgi:hypothetical protein